MPIYEYQCKKCGDHIEIIQSIDAVSSIDCPNCHKQTLKRLISPVGFQLKGNGWYVTDFRDRDSKSKKEMCPLNTEKIKNLKKKEKLTTEN